MVMRKFPAIKNFSWSSSFTEKWNTTTQRSASGRLRTLTNQLYPAWTIKASYQMLTDAQADELLGFAALVKGRFEPFLWLDPEHNKESGVALVEVTDGKYQCVARIGGHTEPTEYVEGVSVYIDGEKLQESDYSVANGIITLKRIPTGKVTADYTYYWRVVLSDDGLTITKKFKDINTCSINLEVAR